MKEDSFAVFIKAKFEALAAKFDERGWEKFYSESRWLFHKKGRTVILDWFTGGVYYKRPIKDNK